MSNKLFAISPRLVVKLILLMISCNLQCISLLNFSSQMFMAYASSSLNTSCFQHPFYFESVIWSHWKFTHMNKKIDFQILPQSPTYAGKYVSLRVQ